MSSLSAPPGFRGLQRDIPLRIYEQMLPHWRQPRATYFVTFRLHDSLPLEKMKYLQRLKAEWKQRKPKLKVPEQADGVMQKIVRLMEKWLDQGAGSCVLKDSAVAKLLVEDLMRDQLSLYDLGCFVVMPNHVHVVIRPLNEEFDLEDILKKWKGHSALEINRLLNRQGVLWQSESHDRIIRDVEELQRIVNYIGQNPARANLTLDASLLWLNPTWEVLGWRF